MSIYTLLGKNQFHIITERRCIYTIRTPMLYDEKCQSVNSRISRTSHVISLRFTIFHFVFTVNFSPSLSQLTRLSYTQLISALLTYYISLVYLVKNYNCFLNIYIIDKFSNTMSNKPCDGISFNEGTYS